MKTIDKECSEFKNVKKLNFNKQLELMIPIILRNKKFNIYQIDNLDSYKYEGDFFTLLSKIGIPYQFHWITLRINNYYSPSEFNGDNKFILIPDLKFLINFFNNNKKREG
jgi:hypothetical protein